MASTHIRRGSVVYFDQRTQLPKAGRHPKAGCSFGILLFFVLFVHECSCAWRKMFSEKKQNSKWATSFWESLPIADQQTFFFVRLTWASRAHDEKGTFLSFSNVFYRFQPCERMLTHAFAGRNTQQGSNFCFLQPFILSDLNYCSMGDCLSLSGHGVPFVGVLIALVGLGCKYR